MWSLKISLGIRQKRVQAISCDVERAGIDYAKVVPVGPHEEWVATVNLHRHMNEHRSATFDSEAAAKTGVREWLRGALASFR